MDQSALEKLEITELPKSSKFSRPRRILILILIAFSGILAPLASTIYFPSVEKITVDLDTTDTLVDITISVFMIVLGVFPLVWGVLSDRFGRRGIQCISLLIFTLSNVGCALSQNIWTLIIMRIFQGIGSSASLVVGIAIVSDIFPAEERGTSMSTFFVGILIGPIIGPIIGGSLEVSLGWRSSFWLLTMVGGIAFLLTLFLLPETLPEHVPFKLSNLKHQLKFNPLYPLYLLKYPVVLLSGLVAGISFTAFFAVESFQSRAMSDRYNMDPSTVGLTFLALGAGSLIGNVFGGSFSDMMYRRALKLQPSKSPEPEIRLKGIWICVLPLVIGLVSYGWFLEFVLPLYSTLIASFFIGIGYTSATIGAAAYLVDLSPKDASSLSAGANFLRMVFSGIFTSINYIIIKNLGYGGGGMLYASLSLLMLFIVFVLLIKGHYLRVRFGPKKNTI